MPKQTAINQALHFIACEQSPGGGFYGYTSTSCMAFNPQKRLPTVFFTALIMRALHGMPGTSDIQSQAAKLLLDNKNANWSWNYWEKSHPIRKKTPYPDDLDDTACALIALSMSAPKSIDGEALAQLAQLLISNEMAPGGPYRTWLVPPKLRSQWGDVDAAVNANIGHLLSLHGVNVAGLENFIATAISKQNLTSPYYVGYIPTLYFLAPWYGGKNRNLLKSLVRQELRDKKHNALMLSMLISACCSLDPAFKALPGAVSRLLSMRQFGHWPAEALYVHSTNSSETVYAGSAALTTALALRALYDYKSAANQKLSVTKQTAGYDSQFLSLALKRAGEVPDSELRKSYSERLTGTIKHDTARQITGIATTTAQAYGVSLRPAVKRYLNLASLHGWIAYTIYDDFLDDEGRPADLGVANLALRRTIRYFRLALPDSGVFQRLVDNTLDSIDIANAWEVAHARAVLRKQKILIGKLPEYGDYSQLASRSWGHMLAPSGVVLTAAKIRSKSTELRRMHKFFHHYLIARQLNDDAHDWEEDLSRGHLSSAVTLLLRSGLGTSKEVVLVEDIDRLRLHFWEQTILEVGQLVKHNTNEARRALASCAMVDSAEYQRWVDILDAAVDQALSKRKETKKFIKTYGRVADIK